MRSPKRPEKSDEGVSATIGTIMALMVFMFLFGMIQTQYVPVAMKDTEANHMHDLEYQFTSIKQTTSSLIRSNDPEDETYNPLTLGSDGIPVFAQPTPGFLRFSPSMEQVHIKYVATENTSGNLSTTAMYGNSSGYLSVYLPNRYYIPEGYAYSCGAVILYQASGSTIVADPSFSIVNKSGDISVKLNIIDLIGDNKTMSGTSTVSVHSHLLYNYQDSFSVSDGGQFISSTLWINLTTTYPEAWVNWFNSTFSDNHMSNRSDFTITKELANSNVYPNIYNISIKIDDVKMFSMKRSLVEMKIGET